MLGLELETLAATPSSTHDGVRGGPRHVQGLGLWFGLGLESRLGLGLGLRAGLRIHKKLLLTLGTHAGECPHLQLRSRIRNCAMQKADIRSDLRREPGPA